MQALFEGRYYSRTSAIKCERKLEGGVKIAEGACGSMEVKSIIRGHHVYKLSGSLSLAKSWQSY